MIRDLKPALIENVGKEKLFLYFLFLKDILEPGFTSFVKNTLFNQTKFSQLVQAWLNPY